MQLFQLFMQLFQTYPKIAVYSKTRKNNAA